MKKLIALIFALLAGVPLFGQSVPGSMNYQGELVDANGAPLPTGNYRLKFAVFEEPQGGAPLWASPEIEAPVIGGVFNVILESSALGQPLIAAFNGASRYLEIQIGDNPPVAPRQRLLSAPYAFSAARANSLYTPAGSRVYDDGELTVASGASWRSLTVGGNGGADVFVAGTLYNMATIGGHKGDLLSFSDLAINPNGGNVGIGLGESAPTAKLHVNGDLKTAGDITAGGAVTATSFIGDGSALTGLGGLWSASGVNVYRDTGRVGIGTNAPRSAFDVTATGLWHSITAGGSGGANVVVIGNLGGTATIGAHSGGVDAWAKLAINADGGNVGIGTRNPSEKLDVNGTVKATTFAGNGTIPVGGIIMWSGAIDVLPAGWALCDGQTSNGTVTPNLKDRFIVGAGQSYGVGATGGADLKNITIEHMPSHQHGYIDRVSAHYDGWLQAHDGPTGHMIVNPNGSRDLGGFLTSAAGGGALFDVRPQYYALAFIMRVQ